MRRIERVMLIYPPVSISIQGMKQVHPPLGVAYLAAAIRDRVELSVLDAAIEGYEHEERINEKLIQYGLPLSEIERRIEEFKPDLLGISCIFSVQSRNVGEISKVAKRLDPEIITITGGTHPSFLPEFIMEQFPQLDMVVRGEGEFALLDLIEASRSKGEPGDIAGLAWRSDHEVVINPDRTPHPDLDEIPFPARDLFPLERYHEVSVPWGIVYKNQPFMNMITSRGCPYHCTFCSSTNFWGNCYRKRSPQNVLAEMEHLYHDLGIREFKFFDDNLTMDKKRAKEIFRGMIERGIDVTWSTPNGVHAGSLDDEMLELIKKSGGFELTLAIESGDPDVLKNIIKKPIRLEQVEQIVKKIREKGIGTHAFFIIGFPGETKKQIQNTLDFSRKLDLDRISSFIFNPLPGTHLFDECLKKGYIKPGEIKEELDYCEAHFDTPEWTREEIYKLRQRWFWRSNFSLLFRHPIRFLSRYSLFLARPKLMFEVLRRRFRS